MRSRAEHKRLRNRIWPYISLRRELWNVPRAIRGCRRIARSDQEGLHILICDHIGDFLYTMGYLRVLRKKTGYKRITVYITKKLVPLCRMYPGLIDGIIEVPAKRLQRLLLINSTEHGIYEYGKLANLITVNPANAFSTHNYDDIADFPIVHFLDCIKYGCLRLDKNSIFMPPMVSELQASAIRMPSEISNPRRVAILIPKARYLPGLSNVALSALVRGLRDQGYQVYTALEGNHETPCEGTRGWVCSLVELLGIAPRIGLVAGIRCGVFDLLSYTNSRLLVLYTGTAAERNFFSLKNIPGALADIKEYSEQENGRIAYAED